MHDDEGTSSAAGPSVWLALARGGGVLLREVSDAVGHVPSLRAFRARRGSLALTSDAHAPWASNAP